VPPKDMQEEKALLRSQRQETTLGQFSQVVNSRRCLRTLFDQSAFKISSTAYWRKKGQCSSWPTLCGASGEIVSE
jgi:hypothetical protein